MIFYTQLFTSKRGPLAKIWLAAHWERKVTKSHVFECNLETTIRDIISPKMKIGLRTSGHLLIGVVRIYSKKANYLLADCNNALLKIKMAFRPGQTDVPEEGLEATIKAITLIEDFSAFDTEVPNPSNIDVVDHFSLNQCRSEDITLKEDFGNGFLSFTDFGEESQSHRNGLLDMSFQSLAQHGDAFGDEDKGLDLLDFLNNSSDNVESTDFIPEERPNEHPEISTPSYQQDADRKEVETPTLDETTLLANEKEAFALEPVAVTPNSEKKRGKRKRKLVVDQTKELTSEFIKEQLSDYSDLVAPLDMAPPTLQLMQWKESGSADKLFTQPCLTVAAPQIMGVQQTDTAAPGTIISGDWQSSEVKLCSRLLVGSSPPPARALTEGRRTQWSRICVCPRQAVLLSDIKASLFAKSIFQMKFSEREEVEVMRKGGQEVQRDMSALTTDNISVVGSSVGPERTYNTELMNLDHVNDSRRENNSDLTQDENRSDFTHPELPSEDCMFVHPSYMQEETQSTSVHTQSLLDSQDFKERRVTRRAEKLLNTLKNQSNSDTTFTLEALCDGGTRFQAATTFFSLLVLKKQKALHLHQRAPYEDILATPGPTFYD